MPDDRRSSGVMDNEAEITLGVLSAVGENSALTQRSLARDLGIALGLANAYLKRCAKKGLVKVAQVPPNRYAYYLTPTGFAEKSRLTAEYLTQSFKFFRAARSQCGDLFGRCRDRGWCDVALVGVSDLGEIATFVARDHPVRLVGFVDRATNATTFAGLPVSRDLGLLGGVDAALITDVREPQAAFSAAAQVLRPERVLTPPLLKIARPGLDQGS